MPSTPVPHRRGETELPLDLESVDADWLTRALKQWGAHAVVTELFVRHVDRGTGTKMLVTASYANPSSCGNAPPRELCIKAGGFDADMAGFNLAVAFQREADFFVHLAPELDIALMLMNVVDLHSLGRRSG
jgi:hypothetical protein